MKQWPIDRERGEAVLEALPREWQPIVCLPTTSGTGSEVNPSAVITDKERDLKLVLMSNHLIPRLAVIDRLFCRTMPPGLTIASGLLDFYGKLDIKVSLRDEGIRREELEEIACFTSRDAVNMATDPTTPGRRKVWSCWRGCTNPFNPDGARNSFVPPPGNKNDPTPPRGRKRDSAA
jgi:alcohol dehydrogenase class IV